MALKRAAKKERSFGRGCQQHLTTSSPLFAPLSALERGHVKGHIFWVVRILFPLIVYLPKCNSHHLAMLGDS
jgi:hypothetical protein